MPWTLPVSPQKRGLHMKLTSEKTSLLLRLSDPEGEVSQLPSESKPVCSMKLMDQLGKFTHQPSNLPVQSSLKHSLKEDDKNQKEDPKCPRLQDRIGPRLNSTSRQVETSQSNDVYASLILPDPSACEPCLHPLFKALPIPPNPLLLCGEHLNQQSLLSVMNPAIRGLGECVGSTPTAGIVEDVEATTRMANASMVPIQLVWGKDESVISRTARWTETVLPLPSPPEDEFADQEALQTIANHPDLFQVITPINVDCFEALLSSHLNRPFVASVCRGLQDESEFVRVQVVKEIEKGRFSPSFGSELLPGMYSMPVHAVPKPGAKKFHLVTDHSAGQYALNNMISRTDVAGVTLDNVYDLGQALHFFFIAHPHDHLVVWKGDVSEAYRLMPMHPLWQVKQIVTVDSHRYVDHCNVFGGRASQCIWHAFMSLVLWIIVFKLALIFPYLYVDDLFGFACMSSLAFLAPYSKFLPLPLIAILNLWDYLRIPHEEKKQFFAPTLPIISFDVDPNLMRVQMSAESRLLLLEHICAFAHKGTRWSLRDFQRLTGYLNWALNVNFGRELTWFAGHLEDTDGIYFLSSMTWDFTHLPPSTFVIYTDASEVGVEVWMPSLNLGFVCSIPSIYEAKPIFFLKAPTILAAIQLASSHITLHGCLAIFTNNFNSVAMFNTLSALPAYNWLLLAAVDVLLTCGIDFRMFYMPGSENLLADHLSHGWVADALQLLPNMVVSTLEPPHPNRSHP
ncbi:hypothetical protein SCLCIDRAFT_27072 [Scleroderma citrinum Foug A]|uniref:Uncharacterized protein n=1 Tax=Scleroderma citrinum Foug A TaxID=1036808 RepID=A0A0C3A554_9AGAM|nr:hypothetical protein SCLCIDRAFT_27072 [Scleroderma citrinum Foug A]